MCYSAQIKADYRKYLRVTGDRISLQSFYEQFWRRQTDASIKIPRAVEALFADPQNEDEERIKALIDAHNAAQTQKLEQEMFKQRKRLADAQRSLQTKTTKAALESERIATDKVEWALGKLAALRRSELVDEDSRIYPGWYAPVMIRENGHRVVKLMRYQCRPAGKPASHDRQFPGTYNARRDSLEGFWRGQFGQTHGVMIASAFYENVSRHRIEGRQLREGEVAENVVLEFRPRPGQELFVACVWSRWVQEGAPDLLSFAAITDEPPPEIAAAGHDRCIIPLRAENVDEWLSPDAKNLAAQNALLDERARPYYEHRLAA